MAENKGLVVYIGDAAHRRGQRHQCFAQLLCIQDCSRVPMLWRWWTRRNSRTTNSGCHWGRESWWGVHSCHQVQSHLSSSSCLARSLLGVLGFGHASRTCHNDRLSYSPCKPNRMSSLARRQLEIPYASDMLLLLLELKICYLQIISPTTSTLLLLP